MFIKGNAQATDTNIADMETLLSGIKTAVEDKPSYKLKNKQVSTSLLIYGAGDCIGGLLNVPEALVEGKTGLLKSITIIDTSGTQKPDLELFIFGNDPSTAVPPAVLTDQIALEINGALNDLQYSKTVQDTDYVLTDDNYIVSYTDIDAVVESAPDSDGKLYLAVKAVGTPIFPNGNGLIVLLGFERV